MPKRATDRTAALSAEDLAEAAALLREVVELAKAGVLEAKSPEARIFLRKLEGAAIAARLASGAESTG